MIPTGPEHKYDCADENQQQLLLRYAISSHKFLFFFVLYREGRGFTIGPFPCQEVLPIVYLSICGSTALVDFGRLFNFLIYTQSVGLLGRRSACRKAATYTQNNINRE
jgi:hypothetical protein